MKNPHTFRIRAAAVAALAVAAALAPLAPAAADDRDLFRQATGAPYVFVLFDATGSMQWNLGNSNCPRRCDDDPASRMFQAKQALDQVLQNTRGVNFGFATFPNQNGSYAFSKFQTRSGDYINDRETGSAWCQGWEPNVDTTSGDEYRGYTYKFPTVTNSRGLAVGDVVPLDWGDNNVQRIRERLAPNLAVNPNDVPDYGIARYFEDPVCSGDDSDFRCGPPNGSFLRLLDPRSRPFLGRGATPLQGALASFETWYDSWLPQATQNDIGIQLGCRRVFVLLMTDGFETCGGNATVPAARLHGAGVDTFVIGFAVNNEALDDIARAGGSPSRGDVDGDGRDEYAYSAQSQQELIDAFTSILGEIQTQSRTFATAAVPSVGGSSAENVFLTGFSPVEDASSAWPGRLQAFRKPLRAGITQGCSGSGDESCVAWKAEELMLGKTGVGAGASQRRVLYAKQGAQLPRQRAYFRPPPDEDGQNDLYGDGFGVPGDATQQAFLDEGEAILNYALTPRTVTVADPGPTILAPNPSAQKKVKYILGDAFHSDPVVVQDPKRFEYFTAGLEAQTEVCDPRFSADEFKKSYPCFVKRHLFRRRTLFIGTNEGQLHAFDAGTPFRNSDGFVEFSAGSGEEIFSYVPRSVMPKIRELKEGSGHQFTTDGTVVVDDVLIDPQHAGIPSKADREWRTVLIGGLREGGRSYYALDVTHPDADGTLSPSDPEPVALPQVSGHVPGCLDSSFTTSGCSGPYPAPLWELGDDWDEDGNDAPDLGFTWSQVNTGRIRVIEGGDVVEKYVAIFGGGMDPDFKRTPLDENDEPNPYMGNFLYMVDIETGNIIYKRRLDLVSGLVVPGSAPSETAAVDLDRNSYLDTVYVGTTSGYLFKVDISEPQELGTTSVPNYAEVDPVSGLPPRMREVTRVTSPVWEPFPVFSTGGRPIHYPPSVVFVADVARFAIAFGTGDREDLWADQSPADSRFYLFLDEGFAPGDLAAPLVESDLRVIDAGAPIDPDTEPTSDLPDDFSQVNPTDDNFFGWALLLADTERLTNRSLSLSGVLFFNTFLPELTGGDQSGRCANVGASRLYRVFTRSARPLLDDIDRFIEVGDFTTQPFVEGESFGDDEPEDETKPPAPDGPCNSDEARNIRQALMSEFPERCRFSQYSLNVLSFLSQSGTECMAQVPVCVVEQNWKEF